jgi:hypothetical protein
MKILLFIFSVYFLVFSCQKESKLDFFDGFFKTPYIISQKDLLRERYLDSTNAANNAVSSLKAQRILMPKTENGFGFGSGNINFIFFKERIYMYKHSPLMNCVVDSVVNPKINLIGLETKDLIQVPGDSLFILAKQTSNFISNGQFLISVSSLSDTINSVHFTQLIDSVRVYKPNWGYFIRRISEEEYHVTNAKVYSIEYDRKNVKWVRRYNYL